MVLYVFLLSREGMREASEETPVEGMCEKCPSQNLYVAIVEQVDVF